MERAIGTVSGSKSALARKRSGLPNRARIPVKNEANSKLGWNPMSNIRVFPSPSVTCFESFGPGLPLRQDPALWPEIYIPVLNVDFL